MPLNPHFKQDELDFYFRNSGVRAVIGDEPGTARVASGSWTAGTSRVQLITTGAGARRRRSRSTRLIEENAGERLAAPRARRARRLPVLLRARRAARSAWRRTHGQCWARGRLLPLAMGISPDDRLFCAIPLFHTYGMGNCLTTPCAPAPRW